MRLPSHVYQGLHVCIAMRNPQLAIAVKSFFYEQDVAGFDVVPDLNVGRRTLEQGGFNLLFVDYDLPITLMADGSGGSYNREGSSGGIQFVNEVRYFTGTRSEMPIVMAIQGPNETLIAEARNAGVNEVLSIPLSADAIDQRLAHIHANPMPFIRSPGYVGPCRRRGRARIMYDGPERRSGEPAPITGMAGMLTAEAGG
ncbi:hypothetical protein [Yunchengibacter salinarum]|uniref:hypothetical protein n=1 Tax=Yunchengibacter salinarum TaxID=3133399 RepID=UPI0035B64C60